MKYKIGVIGSAKKSMTAEISDKGRETGMEIAKRQCFLLTGASDGIPYETVKGAKEAGGFTVGFSPAHDIKEHTEKYGFPINYFDLMIFTGFGLKGRNVPFIRSCDGVVVIGGGAGTLNEITIAYGENKIIGILQGVGDTFGRIFKDLEVENEKIIYESVPGVLVKKLTEAMNLLGNCQHRKMEGS